MPDSMTQILSSGPPGTTVDIAVLGDGFADADQDAYNAKVQDLLLTGVFGHDYFQASAASYNIYRVNLISNESGVSQRVYDEQGTPNVGADDLIVSTTLKDTALRYIFNGSWAHCWLENDADTGARVNAALETWVPDFDLVVIILNEARFGGCGGGGFQIVTMDSAWAVLAHEFGHGLGGLADEYCTDRVYVGPEPSEANATVNTDGATLKWGHLIEPATPIPTGRGGCAGFSEGPRPADWSDTESVGLFEGGQSFNSGIFRPVIDCRMRSNTPPFCPVCRAELDARTAARTGRSPARRTVRTNRGGRTGAAARAGGRGSSTDGRRSAVAGRR